MEAFFHCFDVLIKLTRDKNNFFGQKSDKISGTGRTGETGKQGKSVLIRFQPVFQNKVSTHLDSLTGRY